LSQHFWFAVVWQLLSYDFLPPVRQKEFNMPTATLTSKGRITIPLALRTALGLHVSVITKFDGLMFTFRDGRCGKDLQQNGTDIAEGAVLVMSD
jgi:hypothetical protein